MLDQTVAVSELDTVYAALQRIYLSATSPETPGFMLAFMGRAGVGFNFLTHADNFSLALYAVPALEQFKPDVTCMFQGGRDEDRSFVKSFLETAAQNMETSFDQLVSYFVALRSSWRFESWVGDRPGYMLDNDPIWRRSLWPLAHCIADEPPLCLDCVPLHAREIVLKQLRKHATEGMTDWVK